MWTTIKAVVLRFALRRIRSFITKRGLDLTADHIVSDIIAAFMALEDAKIRLTRSGEIATLRVKYPRVYKKLARDLDNMERALTGVRDAVLKGRETIR